MRQNQMMARHQLADGKHLIAWLSELGRALGYRGAEEWEIEDPLGSTYADLAWLRQEDDEIPIFLFEVESRAGSQLAENAMKILGVPTTAVAKPLFFFHAVLRSGGGRPGRARREHAAANYAIYELDRNGEAERMLANIFTQTARVNRGVDAFAAWQALEQSPLKFDFNAVLDRLEHSMTADWTRAYARLGIESPRARQRLLERLLTVLDGQELNDGYYETFWEQWRHPIHLGLIATTFPQHGEEAFARLRSWQGNGPMKTVGPYFGLSRDYDTFVIFGAGLLWTLTATLFRDVEGAPRWIARQLAMTLEVEDMSFAGVINSATWMLYLSLGLEDRGAFETAVARLEQDGGLAPAYSRDLPFFGIEPDDSAGWQRFRDNLGAERVAVSRETLSGFLSLYDEATLEPETAALLLLAREGTEQVVSDGLLGYLSQCLRSPSPAPELALGSE